MNLNKILINYQSFKKVFRKKQHIDKFMDTKYSDTKFILSGMGASAFVFLAPLFVMVLFNLHSFLTYPPLFVLFLAITIKFLYKYDKKINICFKEHDVFMGYMSTVYCPNMKKAKKIFSFFKRSIKKEESLMFNDIQRISHDILIEAIEEYKKNNRIKFFESGSNYGNKAFSYGQEKSKNLFYTVKYIFNNLENNDIENLDLLNIKKILKDFNTEEQLELTELISIKVNALKKQKDTIKNNISSIYTENEIKKKNNFSFKNNINKNVSNLIINKKGN